MSDFGGEREGVLGHLLYLAEGTTEDDARFRRHALLAIRRLMSAAEQLAVDADEAIISSLK